MASKESSSKIDWQKEVDSRLKPKFKDTGRDAVPIDIIDSYLGGPIRRFVSNKIKDTDTPLAFGSDPESAPSGKDIVKALGVSDKKMFGKDINSYHSIPGALVSLVSKLKRDDAAGFATEMALDPTNYIPGEAIAKNAGKLTGLVGKIEKIDEVANILKKYDTVEKVKAIRGKPEYSEYLKALDATHGDAAKRAKDMGFGDETWYHGAKSNFDSFDLKKADDHYGENIWGRGVYVTDNPKVASGYAITGIGKSGPVLPLRARNAMQNEIIDGGTKISKSKNQFFVNRPANMTNAVIRKENDLRSIFAAFDPRFAKSTDLLAGGVGTIGNGLKEGFIGANLAKKKDNGERMDLENMSVDELQQLKKSRTQKVSGSIDLENMSVDELKALRGNKELLQEPSFLQQMGSKVVDGAVIAGRAIDSITGAPTRASIGALQDGKSPLSAFTSQFAENPDLAPSGRDIAVKEGLNDKNAPLGTFSPGGILKTLGNIPGPLFLASRGAQALLPDSFKEHKFTPSTADLVGGALEVAADPTNLLPALGMAKGVGKGVATSAKAVARGAGLLAKAATPGRVVKSVEATALATKEALSRVLKPTQAVDFKELANIATKNGIDPNILPASVEFGQNSVISRGRRSIAEGPAGQVDMDNFTEAHMQVQHATDEKIKAISGGNPINEPEAGTLIRQGYDDAVDRLFKDVDFTYNSVIDSVPGITLTADSQTRLASKLSGIEKYAKGLSLRGITNTERGQADQLLRAVEAVRAGNGSLKQTYESMSQIGKHAFKKGQNALADIPVDQAKFQELYHTMRNEFIESTAGQLGPDIANKLIDSNQLITDFNKSKDAVSKLIGNKDLAPERLFSSLVTNGDTRKIAALKEILSPEQFNQLKGTLLESLVKRNSDGTVSFGNLYNAMQRKNTRTVLEATFDPQEITEFAEIVKLGNRFGPMVLSTSGTGGSNIFRDMASGIQSSVLNRSVLDIMTDTARKGAIVSSKPKEAAAVGVNTVRRTATDDALKSAQIMGAASTSKDKSEKTAAQRRLEEIRRARGL